MDYESKKLEILKETSELLKEYESFSKKASDLSKKMGHLDGTFANKMDLKHRIILDKDLSKFTRLALALLYVENPDEEEIVEAMFEDVMKHKAVEEEIELPEPIKITK